MSTQPPKSTKPIHISIPYLENLFKGIKNKPTNHKCQRFIKIFR